MPIKAEKGTRSSSFHSDRHLQYQLELNAKRDTNIHKKIHNLINQQC